MVSCVTFTIFCPNVSHIVIEKTNSYRHGLTSPHRLVQIDSPQHSGCEPVTWTTLSQVVQNEPSKKSYFKTNVHEPSSPRMHVLPVLPHATTHHRLLPAACCVLPTKMLPHPCLLFFLFLPLPPPSSSSFLLPPLPPPPLLLLLPIRNTNSYWYTIYWYTSIVQYKPARPTTNQVRVWKTTFPGYRDSLLLFRIVITHARKRTNGYQCEHQSSKK